MQQVEWMRRVCLPLKDAQRRTPGGWCRTCGGELWGGEAAPDRWGRTECPQCREEREGTYGKLYSVQ